MSIDKLIDQLDREAKFQLASLSKEGYRATLDEVMSEVCLAFSEAIRAYKKSKNHSAQFDTFFAGCVRLGMKVFKRRLREYSKINLTAEIENLAVVEPDNGTSLIVEEIDKQLSEHEKAVLNYMLLGGEQPEFSGYYNAVSRVRSIAKKVMEV